MIASTVPASLPGQVDFPYGDVPASAVAASAVPASGATKLTLEPAAESALQATLAGHPVLPRLRAGQLGATAVVLLLLAWAAAGLVSNSHYQWGRFAHWFGTDTIISGLWVTLEVTAWSALLGLGAGVLLAVARLSDNALLRATSWFYIWFFRSVPLILLLLILFNFSYFYPSLSLGIPFGPSFLRAQTGTLFSSPMLMGVLGLGLTEAAYAAELIRGGIASVEHGQSEAATALGFSPARQLRRVVLPQALRSIVPGYVNQIINLIKSSALVYYVSLSDIFGQVNLLKSRFPTDVVPLLLVGAAWYLILTAVLSAAQFYAERYFARGTSRSLPQSPWRKLRTSAHNTRVLARDLRGRLAEASAQ